MNFALITYPCSTTEDGRESKMCRAAAINLRICKICVVVLSTVTDDHLLLRLSFFEASTVSGVISLIESCRPAALIKFCNKTLLLCLQE